MKYIFLLGALAVTLPFPTQQEEHEDEADFLQCFPNNALTEADHDVLTSKIIRSRLEFTIDFTREVLKRSKSGTNLFFSPHSVYKALLLALFISNNKTEKEIRDALRISPGLVSTVE